MYFLREHSIRPFQQVFSTVQFEEMNSACREISGRVAARIIISLAYAKPLNLGHFLEALYLVDPWIRLTSSEAYSLVVNVLAPRMCDERTTQQLHSLLSKMVVSWFLYAYKIEEPEFVKAFALSVHVMLDKRKEEAWFYLDAMGSQWAGLVNDDPQCRVILTVLQHFGTPVLLLETLEKDRDLARLPKSESARLGIVLTLMILFAEYNILSRWEESMHDRLLACLSRCLQAGVHTRLVTHVLAASDSKMLSQLDLSFLSLIRTSSDVPDYCRLLERLTSSSQLLVKVAPFLEWGDLFPLLLDAWKNETSFSQNAYLWGTLANLADWVAMKSPNSWSHFAFIASKKIELSKTMFPFAFVAQSVFDNSILTLSLKVNMSSAMNYVNPRYVWYTQDSISPRFRSYHQSVEGTTRSLRDRTQTAHRIDHIGVFSWNGNVHTEDNRRLYAFKGAGLTCVPVQWTTLAFVNPNKLTTTNGGSSINVRGGGR